MTSDPMRQAGRNVRQSAAGIRFAIPSPTPQKTRKQHIVIIDEVAFVAHRSSSAGQRVTEGAPVLR